MTRDELLKNGGKVVAAPKMTREQLLGGGGKVVQPTAKPQAPAPAAAAPKPNILQRIGDATLKPAAEKVIIPAGKAIAKDLFGATAATAVSAVRGAWNLLTGNVKAEEQAQLKDKARRGVDLGPFGVQKPVQMNAQTGEQNSTGRAAQEMVGEGAKLASVLIGGEAGAMGAAAAAPAAATGLFAGGTAGLVHGAGHALSEDSKAGKGALETVGDVGMGATTEGAAGAATGYLGGKFSDWWNKPIKAAAPEPKVTEIPTGPAGPAKKSILSKATDEVKRRQGPVPSDAVKKQVLDTAAQLDAATPAPSDVSGLNEIIDNAGKPVPAIPKPTQPATTSAQRLLDSGLDPNDLQDLSSLSKSDLTAVVKAVENGQRISAAPSDASKIRVNEGVAGNLMAKYDALEETNKPISKALRAAVVDASTATFDKPKLEQYVVDALPDRTFKWTEADKKFIDGIIDKVDSVRTQLDAHELRQYIANETDAFTAPLKAAGVKNTQGEATAKAIRTAIGKYLDETIPQYGPLRNQERPILDAMDEFWARVGGKWKGYDGDAADRRVAEIAGRISSKASGDVARMVETLDGALKGVGLEGVGGDIAKQDYYTRLVENLFHAGPPGSLKGQVEQAAIQAGPALHAMQDPKGAFLKAVVNKGLEASGFGGKRASERATAEIRQAFADYVISLLRAAK